MKKIVTLLALASNIYVANAVTTTPYIGYAQTYITGGLGAVETIVADNGKCFLAKEVTDINWSNNCRFTPMSTTANEKVTSIAPASVTIAGASSLAFMATTDNGSIYASRVGTDWTKIAVTQQGSPLQQIINLDINQWLAVGDGGAFVSSDNGSHWHNLNVPQILSSVSEFSQAGRSGIVAVGEDGYIGIIQDANNSNMNFRPLSSSFPKTDFSKVIETEEGFLALGSKRIDGSGVSVLVDGDPNVSSHIRIIPGLPKATKFSAAHDYTQGIVIATADSDSQNVYVLNLHAQNLQWVRKPFSPRGQSNIKLANIYFTYKVGDDIDYTKCFVILSEAGYYYFKYLNGNITGINFVQLHP